MPVQYEVRTAWYNYTHRDGTTYAGILLSRNCTKTGRYMILACDVTPGVRSVVRGVALRSQTSYGYPGHNAPSHS